MMTAAKHNVNVSLLVMEAAPLAKRNRWAPSVFEYLFVRAVFGIVHLQSFLSELLATKDEKSKDILTVNKFSVI